MTDPKAEMKHGDALYDAVLSAIFQNFDSEELTVNRVVDIVRAATPTTGFNAGLEAAIDAVKATGNYERQVNAIRKLKTTEPGADGWRSTVEQLVGAQANDEGLWFVATTASEAYLQQELRKLHAAIEGTDFFGNRPTPPSPEKRDE